MCFTKRKSSAGKNTGTSFISQSANALCLHDNLLMLRNLMSSFRMPFFLSERFFPQHQSMLSKTDKTIDLENITSCSIEISKKRRKLKKYPYLCLRNVGVVPFTKATKGTTKRESGESPEQTRCCKLRLRAEHIPFATVRRADGKAFRHGSKSEDLPTFRNS